MREVLLVAVVDGVVRLVECCILSTSRNTDFIKQVNYRYFYLYLHTFIVLAKDKKLPNKDFYTGIFKTLNKYLPIMKLNR